ncbi:MAG: hypothetical protein QM751_13870 [Paludibacteraceae bacterium]
MKKILLLIAVVFAGLAAAAQAKTVDSAAVAKHKQVQNPAAWACPTCFKITKEGGQCADDKTAKVQLGTYYCQHCVKATGNKPGKCSMCGGETTQMTRKLCAQHNAAPAKKAA